MNDPIRRLSVVALVLVLALMGAATWIQFVQADSLNADNRNVRTLYREYGNFRGPMIVDGNAVVSSVPVDDPFNYQRTYTDGELYAGVSGYYSIVFGRSGLEATENALLNGSADALFWNRLGDLLNGQEQRGASIELTLRDELQRVAAESLGDNKGAVVALDPRTGEILAMVTSPTYDPALLAGHDSSVVNDNYQALIADEDDPMINRAIGGDTYPPGSVFKLITTAAALENGYDPDTLVPAPDELPLPQSSRVMRNYGGAACTSAEDKTMELSDALRISCNTAYADLGMTLGWDTIAPVAEAFGWEDAVDIPLAVTASRLPEDPDVPQTAMSAIGQYDVRATPLQIAMLGAGIANEGVVMNPYLVAGVRSADLKVLSTTEPTVYGQPISATTAREITQMMVGVVDDGTGRSAQIPGVSVAGKTGTAETGTDTAPHAWFLGFAPANNPSVVVAVIVENGGDMGSEATGGRVAAPIARDVIAAALDLQESEGSN